MFSSIFTSEGRQAVRDANEELRLLSQRSALGVDIKNQDRYKESLEIRRRGMRDRIIATVISSGILIGTISMMINEKTSQVINGKQKAKTPVHKKLDAPAELSTIATSSQQEEEAIQIKEIPREEKLLAATDILEKNGLCTVTWHHPEGHEGPTPTKDAMIVICHVHQDPHTGALRNDEHLLSLYYDLQILLDLEECGLRDFHFEGVSATQSIKPQRIGDTPEEGFFTREKQREKLRDKNFFVSIFSQFRNGADFPIVDSAFAAICKDGTTYLGSENPETADDWQAAVDRVKTAGKHARPLLAGHCRFNSGSGMVSVLLKEPLPEQVNPLVISYQSYLDVVQEYIDATYALNNMAWEPRENYIAEELDADVLLIGGAHSSGLEKKLPAHGRSVAIAQTPLYKKIEEERGGIDPATLLQPTNAENAVKELNMLIERWKRGELK